MKFDLVGQRLERTRWLCNIAGAIGLLAVLAQAQNQDTLTLDRASAKIRQHPSLSALNLEIAAREKQVLQAGAFQNPRLGVEAENFAGTGPLSGVQGMETTARLEQTVELGGKRSLRRGQAQAEMRIAQSDRSLREIELLSELWEVFSEAARLQGRIRLLEHDTAFLKDAVEVAQRRSRAGGGGVAEEDKLRLSFSQALSEAKSARMELEVAFQQISLLMGLPNPDFTAVRESEVTPPPEWAMVVQNIEKHPEIARWQSERELRLLSLRGARAQNVPDLDFNAGVKRLNADGGDWAVVGGVSVPLPVWNRNTGAVSGSELRVRGSQQSTEAARRALTAEAYVLWSRLRVKSGEIERLRDELLPQAAQVRDACKAAYSQGRLGVLELLDGQKTWLELNGHYFDLVAAYRRDAGKLEALMGASQPFETE